MSKIPIGYVGDPGLSVEDLNLSGFLTYLNTDGANLAAYKGDICAYLSGKPGIPAGYWRLPTRAEFDPGYPDEPFSAGLYYTAVGEPFPAQDLSSEIEYGVYEIPYGYSLTYQVDGSNKTTFFPLSGYRSNYQSVSMSVGNYSSIWASSIGDSEYNASCLSLRSSIAYVGPDIASRDDALPVRCVKK
jgi:hypothetical protein